MTGSKQGSGGPTPEMARARMLGHEMGARGVDTLSLLKFADDNWPNQPKVKAAFFDGVTDAMKG